MDYIEYLNKEIPTWMKELRVEDEQRIHSAFMECYNRYATIELYKRYGKEQPENKDSYDQDIARLEIKLAQKKEELRIVTEEAKKNLKKGKSFYEQTVEKVQKELDRFQYSDQYMEEMKKNNIEEEQKRRK